MSNLLPATKKKHTAPTPSAAKQNDAFPRPLVLSADAEAIADHLSAFRAQWSNYARAASVNSWPAARQTATLLAAIGPNFAADWRQLEPTLTHGDRSSAGALLNVIGRHLIGDQKRLHRFNFGKQARYDGEPYGPYLKRLQQHIDGCQYGERRDDVLLDKIIASANDDELSAVLCAMEGLTLEMAIDRCLRDVNGYQRQQLVQSLMTPSSSGKSTTKNHKLKAAAVSEPPVLTKKQLWYANYMKVKAEKRQRNATKQDNTEPAPDPMSSATSSAVVVESTDSDLLLLPCDRCGDQSRGEDHLFSPTLCPAHGHKCTKCGALNHSELVCDQS